MQWLLNCCCGIYDDSKQPWPIKSVQDFINLIELWKKQGVNLVEQVFSLNINRIITLIAGAKRPSIAELAGVQQIF